MIHSEQIAKAAIEACAKPIKVMQDTPDNCMRACLASYFGCSIAETPPLLAKDWMQEIREWVRPRGLGFVTIAVPTEEVFKTAFSGGYLIVSGKSKRGRAHAVIYKDGQLWHDPHPESSGIDCVEQVDFFYSLSPVDLVAALPKEPTALHASAVEGYKCADCSIDGEACPDCYEAWWKKRHPNTVVEAAIDTAHSEERKA